MIRSPGKAAAQRTNSALDDISEWLESKGGARPRNPSSDHATLELDDISEWNQRWDILAEDNN
jgi:hypothetical protein